MKTLWTTLISVLFGPRPQAAPVTLWQETMTSYHRDAVDTNRYGEALMSRGKWAGYSLRWQKDAMGKSLGDWYVLRMVR